MWWVLERSGQLLSKSGGKASAFQHCSVLTHSESKICGASRQTYEGNTVTSNPSSLFLVFINHIYANMTVLSIILASMTSHDSFLSQN